MYDNIEDYLEKRLSESEAMAFEATLSHDKELKLIVENFNEVRIVSEGTLELELLNEIENLKATSGLKDKWLPLKIILGAIVLLLLGYWALS